MALTSVGQCMVGWWAPHTVLWQTRAYSVSDYKSKNKESLKPPFSSPPAVKIAFHSIYLNWKLSIGKKNANIPGNQVKISPSSEGGLSIERGLIHCLSPIRTHRELQAHMLLFWLETETSQSQAITVTFTSVMGLIWNCTILKYLSGFAAC